jgi:hypothetical protein
MICPWIDIYHSELICQCVQDKTECLGLVENCENKIGRKCYEEEREEQNG